MKLEQLFSQQQALEIANHDQQIVDKLRAMFLQTLPEQLQIAKQLYQKQQIDQLQQHLHQLLGSAKICAAKPLIQSISNLKQQLGKQSQPIAWEVFCQQITLLIQLK